jgi:hypothetical protein
LNYKQFRRLHAREKSDTLKLQCDFTCQRTAKLIAYVITSFIKAD